MRNEVIVKRYMTDHEEDGRVIAESANSTCASSIPAGCRKSLGNEDIQLAYGWIRRRLDVNDSR
jgi:hypothetical protein